MQDNELADQLAKKELQSYSYLLKKYIIQQNYIYVKNSKNWLIDINDAL